MPLDEETSAHCRPLQHRLGPVDFLRKVIVFQLVIKKRQFIKIFVYQLVRSVLSEKSTGPSTPAYKIWKQKLHTSHSLCAVVTGHQASSHRKLIWSQFPGLPNRRPKGGSYFAFLYHRFLSLKTEEPASRALTRGPAAVPAPRQAASVRSLIFSRCVPASAPLAAWPPARWVSRPFPVQPLTASRRFA